MKFQNLKKIAERVSKEYHIPIDDVEFEVSLEPMESAPEDGIRYLGEIHELMVDRGRVMILSDGEKNIKL